MKTIRKLEIEKVIREIKEALRSSRMETANFSDMNQKLTILKQKEVTEFIKNRTRLYRDAWITAPLERALKILEEEINRK